MSRSRVTIFSRGVTPSVPIEAPTNPRLKGRPFTRAITSGGKEGKPTHRVIVKERIPQPEDDITCHFRTSVEDVSFLELMRFLYPKRRQENPCPKARLDFSSVAASEDLRTGVIVRNTCAESRQDLPPEVFKEWCKAYRENRAGISQAMEDTIQIFFYATVFAAKDVKFNNCSLISDSSGNPLHVIMHDGEMLGCGKADRESLVQSPFLPPSTKLTPHNFPLVYLEGLRADNEDQIDDMQPEYRNLVRGRDYEKDIVLLQQLHLFPNIQKIKWKALIRIACIPDEMVEKFLAFKNPEIREAYQLYKREKNGSRAVTAAAIANLGEEESKSEQRGSERTCTENFDTYLLRFGASDSLVVRKITMLCKQAFKVEQRFIEDIHNARMLVCEIPEAHAYLCSAECQTDLQVWLDSKKDHCFMGKQERDGFTPQQREKIEIQFLNLEKDYLANNIICELEKYQQVVNNRSCVTRFFHDCAKPWLTQDKLDNVNRVIEELKRLVQRKAPTTADIESCKEEIKRCVGDLINHHEFNEGSLGIILRNVQYMLDHKGDHPPRRNRENECREVYYRQFAL